MVLKTLVDAILQSQRDPYNLLHVQLVQTLKKDISRDVTEAFTASQPLVDQDYEAHIKSWREKTIQCEATIKRLQENVLHYEVENNNLREKLSNCQAELDECLHKENNKLNTGLFVHNYQIEEPSRQSALEFSSTGGDDTTCQALEYPSQNERVLGEMVEWKQELRSFLEQFKKDMSTNFTLTTEQNEKISKLLETLHPVQPSSSESSAESKVSVDEISTKLFDTFEQLLHRKLSKDHLKHMLKTFQLDEHFDFLESNLSAVMKKSQRQKVLNHVNNTKYRVKEVIESFFQKLSTLFGSDLPSLHLMERLDFLEQKYLAKNTELAKEPSKLHEFVRQHFLKIAFSENWQELFMNQVISFKEMIASFQESLKTIANRWNFHYIPGLEHEWFETMEKKLHYSHSLEKQLTETNIKLKSIYETMLSNLDDRTKLAALQNPTTIDQQFFDCVNNSVQQLRNELDEARNNWY
ncbi:uncharacterized protein TNCV_610241 [Trichonephila clavipes]|nr:uncharacterized protein TNCV_610241 [Trichonephila clavipes]